jgi:outer membrane protein
MTLVKTLKSLNAALLVGFGLLAAPVQSETLSDTLVSAYNNSGLLDQNRALLRAADEDVAQAVAALRPIIRWSSNVTYASPSRALDGDNLSGGLDLTGQITLYDFGANKLAVEAAKETVLATRESLVSVEQAVLLRAVRAFMTVRRETEVLALRQNNVRLITQELRATRDRFEVGEVTRTDVALAEARLASARSALAAAEGGLLQAREEYRAAVGRLPGSLQAPSGLPQTADSLEDAKRIAFRTHPDILRAQRDVTVAELNIKRTALSTRPTVSLSGGVSFDEDFESSESLTLSAGSTLYQGGALNALARQAAARRDAARHGLHIVRLDVGQQVGNALASLRVAVASKEATDRQIEAARTAFRGVREEATLGARTTLDVLNAEQELLDAETALVSSAIDEQIAAYSLLASMGLLTARHLGLGVETYDPAAYYDLVKTAPSSYSKQGQQLDRVLRALGKN